MIAVISDIHGNLWALQAVLQDLDRLSPSQVIVAGDLALGGPRPAECVELVNPGSVGLPFDGDQRASYAMLSVEGGRWRATLRRVPYDVAAAVGALRGSGNPEAERFARRLERASGR